LEDRSSVRFWPNFFKFGPIHVLVCMRLKLLLLQHIAGRRRLNTLRKLRAASGSGSTSSSSDSSILTSSSSSLSIWTNAHLHSRFGHRQSTHLSSPRPPSPHPIPTQLSKLDAIGSMSIRQNRWPSRSAFITHVFLLLTNFYDSFVSVYKDSRCTVLEVVT